MSEPRRKHFRPEWNQQGVTEERHLSVREAEELAASHERGCPEHQPVWDKQLFELQSDYVQEHFRT